MCMRESKSFHLLKAASSTVQRNKVIARKNPTDSELDATLAIYTLRVGCASVKQNKEKKIIKKNSPVSGSMQNKMREEKRNAKQKRKVVVEKTFKKKKEQIWS